MSNIFLSHVLGPIQQCFKPTESPFIKELPEPLLYIDGQEDLLDLCEDQADNPVHEDDISAYAGPFHSKPNEDEPDPFMVESNNSMPPMSGIQREPDHLLIIYAIVAWLHMQFLLLYIACNTLLMFLACLLTFLIPGTQLPFVTLHSTTHTLSIDPQIHLLAVCPNCQDIFPLASSKYMQDGCAACKTPLFLSNQTKQGNLHTIKTPRIKYPYLPLSNQITALLKIPGIEALLD